MSVSGVSGTIGSPKLELEAAVSSHVGAGNLGLSEQPVLLATVISPGP